MARLWTNSIRGELSSGVTAGDTTLEADIFAELPTVSGGDTLRLTLDPGRDEGLGKPEVVEVTAHSASSTSVTVTRAVETGNNGGSAQAWPSGTTVVHALTSGDADEFVTETSANATYPTRITSDTTFQIPTDYADLQSAIDDLANRVPDRGVVVTLNIETGHAPASGISVTDGDYSMFRIAAADAVVTVDGTFTGDMIRGDRAPLPRLSCLIDMNDLGDDGYAAYDGSTGWVDSGRGVRNAGGATAGTGRGCYINNSRVFARQAEFTGCANGNVWATRASLFDGEEGTFGSSKGGGSAVTIRRGSLGNVPSADISNATCDNAALEVVRGKCHATDVNVSGSSSEGMRASQGSEIGAALRTTGSDASGAGTTGVFADTGSSIDFRDGDASNCGSHGIRSNRASAVAASGATLTGCTDNGAFVDSASYADLGDADCSNATNENGVYAIGASNVDFGGGTADNCGSDGVRSDRGSTVNCFQAQLTGNAANDARVLRGGQVILNSATTSSGSPAVGDTNVSSFNAIDNGNGIIWD